MCALKGEIKSCSGSCALSRQNDIVTIFRVTTLGKRGHLGGAFAAENRALRRGSFVFKSFGTNSFIFGVFCVFSPKGKQKQMKIQPKPNQNTSLPLTRTSSSVSSHGEEKFSKCILSLAATYLSKSKLIFMRIQLLKEQVAKLWEHIVCRLCWPNLALQLLVRVRELGTWVWPW